MALVGHQEAIRRLVDATLLSWDEAGEALEFACNGVMKESKEECPVEVGTLRRSASTERIGSMNEQTVILSYNTVYARRQHEDLSFRHREGKKAKFLEDPCRRNEKKVLITMRNRCIRTVEKRAL